MLSLEAMRQIKDSYTSQPSAMREVLERLGSPAPEEIVEAALAGMQSEDRNVRVLMLRVLKHQTGENAMRGVLAGLNDPMRRVRSVAVMSSGNYLQFSEVTDRLKQLVTDEHEKRKIRSQALSTLSGASQKAKEDLSDTVTGALQSLAQTEQYRFNILFGLLRLDLTERVEALLREFVKDGTKAEAIMATRALCGYRVIHIDSFAYDKAVQKRILQTCELAAGRMFYWITRAEYEALRTSSSQTTT